MNTPPRFLLLGLVLAAVSSAAAEPIPPPLSAELTRLAPAPLLPRDGPAEFSFRDNTTGTDRATFTAIPGASPVQAFRAEIPTRGKNTYDVETKFKTVAAVKKGDVVFARFMARAPVAKQESGEGSLGFAFQRGVAPWENSLKTTVAPGPEWTLFELPFTVANDFADGEAVAAFTFADLAQTVEISGLELLDFGTRARVEQLPATRFTYRGREDSAAWRNAALARIEAIRTAPLAVHVVDAAGKPLAGARVEARLIQSEFIWGTSVDDQVIVADTPDAERYRATLLQFFNTAVIENGLKWKTWINGEARQAIAVRALDWINRQGLRHKGHNLIWPGWKFSPAGLKDQPDLPNALPRLITAHISEMMPVTRGRSYGWDVVNESVHEKDYFTLIPEAAMADWYKLAQSLDPDAQLFHNEYAMLNSAQSPSMIARFREQVGRLRAAGAPIGGLGVQSHIGQLPRAPEAVLADLDLIAAEGLPVQITEFDVNTKDEALQADYTRDFLIACYSHPGVTGFIMWGFWQGRHWKPDAAMFRPDWSEKPNAAVWREWVLSKWATHLDTVTAADGAAGVRGHLGRYRLTVVRDGVINRQDFTLAHGGAEITVKFP